MVSPPLNDDQGRIDVDIGFADCSDDPVSAPFSRPEIDEQHLVFVVMNDFVQLRPQAHQIHARELALEDRELQVIPPGPHGLEDLSQALGISDVVADNVGVAHGNNGNSGGRLRLGLGAAGNHHDHRYELAVVAHTGTAGAKLRYLSLVIR